MEWKSQRAQHTITLCKVLLLNDTSHDSEMNGNDPADSILPTPNMTLQVNVIISQKNTIQKHCNDTLYIILCFNA